MEIDNRPRIAIVGMSGVFPKAIGISEFWHNIFHKVDATDDVLRHRYKGPIDWIYNSRLEPDKAYSLRACAVDDSRVTIEAPGLPSDQVERLDPLLRWVLFATKDALAQCRIDSIDRQKVGTVLAAIALPTRTSSTVSKRMYFNKVLSKTAGLQSSEDLTNIERLSGRVVSTPAAIVAGAFGFGGGAYTLDAACASSLYAVKLACDELQSHRCDAMIAGGVSGADSLYTQIGFSQLRALSPSGCCAPFDAAADGLVVGEGAGVLVLKRLDDALRDDDTIYGTIEGIGLSNDMRGNLLAPESAGQLRAMQAAYAQAQWQPWDVDHIECHGTGTPVGDAIEIQSLRELWRDAPAATGQCAIGSIKSMIGHLLTAAGAASMIKTLLALRHKTLPPSLNFKQAAADSPLVDGPFHVQTEAAAWTRRDDATPRRAAVSAFGFGGINAHILIQEWRAEEKASCRGKSNTTQSIRQTIDTGAGRVPNSSEPIAIVGMEVCLGPLTCLKAFQHAVFNGRPALIAPPAQRWKIADETVQIVGRKNLQGGFISHVDMQIGEFKIPPGEITDILPQQLLMLKVAAAAMRDAGLPLDDPRERMGTIIGIAFDYEANNYNLRWELPELILEWINASGQKMDAAAMNAWLSAARADFGKPLTAPRVLGALGGIVASRVAREFRFGGPSFVVSSDAASGLRAVEIAMRMLQARHTDAMLVGAVDLACDERNLATLVDRLNWSANDDILPFDRKSAGTLPGEGAVALVLKRLDDARQNNDRIYAVIGGTGGAHGGHLNDRLASESAYRASFERALRDADIRPEVVGMVETHGSGIAAEDAIETEALHHLFCAEGESGGKSIAVGATKPVVGHSGAVAGLAAMAKTALCLFHHQVAPMPNFSMANHALWQQGPFYFPQKSAYWAWDRCDGMRTACVAAMTEDSGCMHAVLYQNEDETTSQARPRMEGQRQRPLGPLPFGLFICQGDDDGALLSCLEKLEASLPLSVDTAQPGLLEMLAHRWYQNNRPIMSNAHTVAIVAESLNDLRTRIAEAQQAVQNNTTLTMGARGGAVYLPQRDLNGKTAFVYPGSGNHYVGMGRTIGAHFPEVLRDMHAGTQRLKSQMLPHLYDPWRSDWPSNWQSDQYQELISDPLHCIFGQIVFGGQMTRLLRRFNLQPDAVIGYSLGESDGLFAMEAWSDQGQMLSRLAVSDLFKDQLAGACRSLRQQWQLSDDQQIQWAVAVINRKASLVDEVLERAAYVRRLIVNTPNECVIGGLKEQVQNVVDTLQCEALYLDGVVTVHCDAALPVAEAYKELHRFPTRSVPGVEFYSCARGEAYTLTSEDAAASIMLQATQGFDFTKTIEQAYADGIRSFIEIGPQSSCTRMIRQILSDKPHLAVAANIRAEDECLTLLKCLGTVAAGGIEVDLAPLYGYPADHFNVDMQPGANTIRVVVGGQTAMTLPPLPAFSKEPVPVQRDNKISEKPKIVSPPEIQPGPTQPLGQTADTTMPHLKQFEEMLKDLKANVSATAQAHEQFLELSREMTEQYGEAFQLQNQLIGSLANTTGDGAYLAPQGDVEPVMDTLPPSSMPVAFTREQCLEFAIGSVGKVLGPEFDIIDTYKARVRLPDEPLMLVDRIILVEGEKCSMSSGRVVTEHDVLPDAWYLDGGRAPVCISVEAGQADLFLSNYLGIDHQVKGERTYRLLDANIHFHRSLPKPGETIRYDIHIDKFVKQGATFLFFFRYEGYIGQEHLITMTDGCAGFFTEQEVTNSGGIILTDEDRTTDLHIQGTPFTPLVALAQENYDDARIEALRSGDAGLCFAGPFEGIHLPESLQLPGGRMRLIHRVVELDPKGGRWGLGTIKAEADIHPDDWFLTCHFVDDKVMPGTLMYECCAHTLRVLLLRMGWVTDKPGVFYEPVRNTPCRLKCRGPVTPETQHVHYVVELKQIGYHPEPFVVADAHMYADGRYIVFFKDMTMQMTGVTGEEIENFWRTRQSMPPTPQIPVAPAGRPTVLYSREQILAYAIGKPSQAFGEPYKPFDEDRIIARLPGPPYCFMDRVIHVEPEPWVLAADGWVTAQYDMPANEWYFSADGNGVMPFCVLLEIALQPCGWLAAYAGSALRSQKDLKFRNLGGQGVIHRMVYPEPRTLTMRTRMTKVSEAVDMIIENFDFEVLLDDQSIYSGTTYFGFFSAQALATQVGLREKRPMPDANDLQMAQQQVFVDRAPLTPQDAAGLGLEAPHGLRMPAKAIRMIDGIEIYNPNGGPHGLGFIRGYKQVDPDEWFFKAHFYQDPVCPGSLGVESFLQLVKYAAMQRWPGLIDSHRFEMVCGHEHQWQYRGQIIQTNSRVVVDAVVTHIENGVEPVIWADGWLQVDGLTIYKMDSFGLKLVKS